MPSSTLLRSLFDYKAWANAELLGRMAEVDAAAHPDGVHAAVRVLNHTCVVDRIFAAHLSGAAHAFSASNTIETPSLAELTSSIATSDRWYVDYAGTIAPARLSESLTFTFTDGQPGRMTREEMLMHVIVHGGYHRGAVGQMLSQISIAPPRDTLTAYLHKADPSRRGA